MLFEANIFRIALRTRIRPVMVGYDDPCMKDLRPPAHATRWVGPQPCIIRDMLCTSEKWTMSPAKCST